MCECIHVWQNGDAHIYRAIASNNYATPALN